METIIAAAITGGLALIGVVITSNANGRKIENQLRVHQAVTDCKIDELTREVREHNNFAKRMPAVEAEIKGIHQKIDILHSGEK